MGADLGIRLKNPPHVGGFVKHEIVAPLNLTVTDAAKALGGFGCLCSRRGGGHTVSGPARFAHRQPARPDCAPNARRRQIEEALYSR